MTQSDSIYQVFFTRSAASTISTNPDFLRPFLDGIEQGLAINAEVETPLRKPLRSDPQSPWIYFFKKEGILYQIEEGSKVKIFLLMHIKEDRNYSPADLESMIQVQQQMEPVILQFCNEPLSISLEEIRERWLKEPQAKLPTQRLELVIECGEKAVALQQSHYFSETVFNLTDQAQYVCGEEIFQDFTGCWWSIIRPVGISTIPYTRLHVTLLQMLLYDKLKSAPLFRYGFAAVGSRDYLQSTDSPSATVYTKIEKGDLPLICYQQGIVLSKLLYQNMSRKPQGIEPFTSDYKWLPVRSKLFTTREKEPILYADPRSAEEYYNNGSVLGHQGQHEAALNAFEKALLLKPNFPEAEASRHVALRALGQA